MRKKYRTVIFCVLAAAGILVGLSGIESTQGQETHTPLKVTFLKVGKADAIVCQCGKETMVIDTGEEEDGEELVAFLKDRGVFWVDILMITHYDQDHVGGADTLLETMDVGEILVPDYEGTSMEYLDFLMAAEQKGMTPVRVKTLTRRTLGEVQMIIEPAAPFKTEKKEVELDNHFSLITTMLHGENRLLFTGDAEKQRIREWLKGEQAVDCDFLKVPHHGVYHTALEELIQTVSPEYSVICSSKKNPADVQTVELLKKYNSYVFETKDGNITLVSDGKKLEMKQELEH